jgi:hypothetical protein
MRLGGWARARRGSTSGAGVGSLRGSRWRTTHALGAHGGFPPLDRALVIAVACELPNQRQLPFSRHSASSIHEVVTAEGLVMSLRTVQRILAEDTLKPWRYRSWIHPRDPDFREKAQVILGLYEGVWEGRRLGLGDLVVCADEKPSIQARRRQVVAPMPGQPGLVESDYQRCGALQYLCAWDVQRGLPGAAARARTGSRPSAGWSTRSWPWSRTARPGGSSGSSTTAPLTAVPDLPSAYVSATPTSSSCTRPSTPRGSINRNFLQHRAAQVADPRRRPRPSPTP